MPRSRACLHGVTCSVARWRFLLTPPHAPLQTGKGVRMSRVRCIAPPSANSTDSFCQARARCQARQGDVKTTGPRETPSRGRRTEIYTELLGENCKGLQFISEVLRPASHPAGSRASAEALVGDG